MYIVGQFRIQRNKRFRVAMLVTAGIQTLTVLQIGEPFDGHSFCLMTCILHLQAFMKEVTGIPTGYTAQRPIAV